MELEMDGGGRGVEGSYPMSRARRLAVVAVLVAAVCLGALPVVVSATGPTDLGGLAPLLGVLAAAVAGLKVVAAVGGALAEFRARRRPWVAAAPIE
jgi:hypothetical protein